MRGGVELLAMLALPALLWVVLRFASPAGRRELPRWMLALLPVGLGMWAAHLSFHLLTGWGSLAPGVLEFGRDLARMGLHLRLAAPDWTREAPLIAASSILPVQMLFLDLGLLGSLYAGWRLTTRPSVRQRTAALLPWAAVAAGLYAMGIWILLQPMQMRGMVGM